MKKLTLKQFKQTIKEELDRPQGMGTGGAPMQDQGSQDDDFDMPKSAETEFDHLHDEQFDSDNDERFDLPWKRHNYEEAHDDPEDRPTFEESFKLPVLSQQLDERSGMDHVATSIRNALNDCANLTSNVIQVLTRKKPEWKEAIQAVRQAEEALDKARQSLMSHG